MSPTLQGALKGGFGEVVVAYDRSEPCKFPSHDRCQERFLWTRKETDLAPHPVDGLMLQVGNAKKIPQALGFENLDPSLQSKQALELACVADGVASPDPV